ncbi:MAG TPA: sigma-70 family RNA polymerase sigma factor [Microlunatus sp.]|nr:sigma-70 family RNA polymerase sigma factor [Microlunatus sp.]
MTSSQDQPAGEFADFYQVTATRTFTAARSVAGGDDHVAHDATQEAYVSMWRCWAEWTGRPVGDAARYVRKIAFNKVADAFRRNRDLPWPDDFEPVNQETGYDEILGRSLRRALFDLINEQPERRRAVAMLWLIDDCTNAEIAKALDIAESTVRTHVERMRALMKPLIARDEDNRGGERS